jgi:hypothetical protein
MSHQGVEVIGEEDVIRALHHLADATRNLEPAHRKAGQLLLDRADPRTPRQSGRLAASGRVDAASDETALVYDEVYAGPIHNGWPAHNISPQPWLLETVDDSQSAVLDVFAHYLEDAIRRF